MLNFIKNTQKKLENILNDKNFTNLYPTKNYEGNIIYLNSKIIIWKKSDDDKEFDYSTLFEKKLGEKFMVLNFSNSQIVNFKIFADNIINYKTPNYPSYNIQFIIEFVLSIKEFLETKKETCFILYDYITCVSTL